MSTYAIYFSPSGNTKKAVCAIAGGIEASYIKYDITTPIRRKRLPAIMEDDTVVIGVPVYGGRIPTIVLPVIEKLYGAGAHAVAVVTYGVREYDDALLELAELLNKQNFMVSGAAALIGEHSFTAKVGTLRPNEKDLMQAEEFGQKVRNKINSCKIVNTGLQIRGNHPYKPYGQKVPVIRLVTTDACSKCGICSNLCPTGAISTTDQKRIDLTKCIKCHTCVKNCPVMAKHFEDENIEKAKSWLEQNYSDVKKENEFYL